MLHLEDVLPRRQDQSNVIRKFSAAANIRFLSVHLVASAFTSEFNKQLKFPS